jgi:cobalt/nickel transport system ATP-binding protein
MPASIELTDLAVLRTDERGASVRAVDGLSLSIAAGERLALVGRNGAGKTSLLLALVGALPVEGRIRVGDVELERKTLDAVRRSVSFVFADPTDQLFCATVADEVAFGPRHRALAPEVVEARVARALGAVGLAAHASRSPHALSLGQQRRVAIAAAMATEPDAILIDEPTAALDPVARRELIHLVRGLDATVVLATHDLDAVLDLDARTLVLDGGRPVAVGPASTILGDEALLERAGLALPLSVAARRA